MAGGQVLEFLQLVNVAAYVLLAAVALVQWLLRRSTPAGWLALTFLVLGGVSIVARVLPEDPSGHTYDLITKFVIGLLLLFPYFLFRFSATFEPASRAAEIAAGALTVGIIVWTAFLPDFPTADEPQPASFRIYAFGILIQWVVCSVLAAARLWRQGSGQPSVARRRMRLMAAAATLMSVLIMVSVATGGGGMQPVEAQIANSLLGFIAATAFFFGFSPPEFVRATWRRGPLEDMRKAVRDLLTAETTEEVTSRLLPHVVGIVGARGIAFLDNDGTVIDSNGLTLEMQEEMRSRVEASKLSHEITDCVVMELPFGCVVVWTSPYAPFFGTEELEILRYLSTLAHLAMERTRASEMRLQLAEAQLRRRQALQINDNVVQGLAVAKYAFELGDDEKAKEKLNETLTAAKRIISELLEELGPEDTIRPGVLVRDRPATTSESKVAD